LKNSAFLTLTAELGIGLELSSESSKISAEIFEQTLCLFVKGLPERKGIDKNIWVKSFIKNILYSKEEIS